MEASQGFMNCSLNFECFSYNPLVSNIEEYGIYLTKFNKSIPQEMEAYSGITLFIAANIRLLSKKRGWLGVDRGTPFISPNALSVETFPCARGVNPLLQTTLRSGFFMRQAMIIVWLLVLNAMWRDVSPLSQTLLTSDPFLRRYWQNSWFWLRIAQYKGMIPALSGTLISSEEKGGQFSATTHSKLSLTAAICNDLIKKSLLLFIVTSLSVTKLLFLVRLVFETFDCLLSWAIETALLILLDLAVLFCPPIDFLLTDLLKVLTFSLALLEVSWIFFNVSYPPEYF